MSCSRYRYISFHSFKIIKVRFQDLSFKGLVEGHSYVYICFKDSKTIILGNNKTKKKKLKAYLFYYEKRIPPANLPLVGVVHPTGAPARRPSFEL